MSPLDITALELLPSSADVVVVASKVRGMAATTILVVVVVVVVPKSTDEAELSWLQ